MQIGTSVGVTLVDGVCLISAVDVVTGLRWFAGNFQDAGLVEAAWGMRQVANDLEFKMILLGVPDAS